MMNLSENLRRMRETSGLGVRELARLSGVQPSTITRIEHGENPNVQSVVKLASALGVSLDCLVLQSSVSDHRIHGPIGDAYAMYDSDPRANGPDGFAAFADAFEVLTRRR